MSNFQEEQDSKKRTMALESIAYELSQLNTNMQLMRDSVRHQNEDVVRSATAEYLKEHLEQIVVETSETTSGPGRVKFKRRHWWQRE